MCHVTLMVGTLCLAWYHSAITASCDANGGKIVFSLVSFAKYMYTSVCPYRLGARMLTLQTSQVTKMKEGNVIAPYVFEKVQVGEAF